MKQFLNNLLNAIVILLWAGGIVCGLALAIKAKAVAAIISTIALGILAFPSVKKVVKRMIGDELQ